MTPRAHIHMQSIAVLLLIYMPVFFGLKWGLDSAYGESAWYFVIIMPPTYFISKRIAERYERRAIKKYNRMLERGQPW